MADVNADILLAAARGLMLAGRWELAGQLLAGVRTNDQREQAGLALAQAQIAVEVRQYRGVGDPAEAMAAAAARISALADQEVAFDLELLRLFADYWAELLPSDGRTPRFGPGGRESGVLDELRDRAGRLADSAPDARRSARAGFYAGLIADNLRGEPARARDLFERALSDCRPGADDDYAAEALRHLGGCALEEGDLALARQRFERSTELAERAGWLPLALAQQALLAELAVKEGDGAAAAALGGEVRRWAAALGLGRLEAQAAALSTAG